MKKKNLILILMLFLISTCCLTSWQLFWKGCFWWNCAPNRDFTVFDWAIPNDLFPEGSFVGKVSPPTDGYLYVEEGNQDVWVGNSRSHAIYIIDRFPTVKRAISNYQRRKERMYDPGSGAKWQTPDNISFYSATADDQYIACGLFFDTNRCEAVIRYQEYIIFFNSDITEEMTFARYEAILFYLDEQISSRLYP